MNIVAESEIISTPFVDHLGIKRDPSVLDDQWQTWRHLWSLGFNIVPASSATKKTVEKWSKWQTERQPEEEFWLYYRLNRPCNMVVITGRRDGFGFVVLDADDDEAEELVRSRCPDTPVKVRTRRGLQRYYRHPGGVRIPQILGHRIGGKVFNLDRKGDGNYVMAPGSVHASGHRYEWVERFTTDLLAAAPVFDPAWLPHEGNPAEQGGWTPGESGDVDHDDAVEACPVPVEDRVRQATRYFADFRGTRSGDDPEGKLFGVAVRLAWGFLLPFEEASDLLTEFGSREGNLDAYGGYYPWDDLREIGHKVRDAIKARYQGTPGDKLRREEPDWEGRLAEVIPSGGREHSPGESPRQPADVVLPPSVSPRELAGVTPGTYEPRMLGKPLPRIVVTNRQLRDITEDAARAVREANDPPRWFMRGGVPVRLVEDQDDRGNALAKLQEMRSGAIKQILSDSATWLRISPKGETVNAFVPDDVVTNLANLPTWDLPRLRSIVETPVFTGSGDLLDRVGYDPASRLWYRPGSGLEGLSVPEHPTAGDVRAAVSLLVDELLEGFPFEDQASRANILGCLLVQFVRPMIDGATPLHLIDAPDSRTGKTLLATVLCQVWSGRAGETNAECHSDEEWNKTLTSLLMEGPAVIFLDNIKYALNSPTLEKILTDRTHKARVLGSNRVATLPIECVWLATANNAHASKDLAGRIVRCRIDARVEFPGLRPATGFRHPRLRQWVAENRAALVSACLTICRAWIVAGRPTGEYTLGGFEEYAGTVGGILDVAGVQGFLGNVRDNFDTVSTVDAQWSAFVEHWRRHHDSDPVTVKALFAIAEDNGLLLNVLSSPTERGRQTQMGSALGNAEGRIFDGWRVERKRGDDGKPQRDRQGSGLYRVVPLAPPVKPPAPVRQDEMTPEVFAAALDATLVPSC